MWEPGLSSGLCYYVHSIESESVIWNIVVCVCRIILNLANCYTVSPFAFKVILVVDDSLLGHLACGNGIQGFCFVNI